MDPRVEKLADIVVEYCLALKKGDWVRVQGVPAAMPFYRAFFKKAIQVGANPFWAPIVDDFIEILLKHGSDEQIGFLSETLKYESEHVDALLGVFGFENTKFLSNTDPAKQAILQRAKKPISDNILGRAAKGELRWTGLGFPIPSLAQDAEMSMAEYEDFVYGAAGVYMEDPVSHWKEVSRKQAEMCEFLESRSEFKIVAEDTELSFSAKGRKWINCDGHENFPDGEVFTGPIENSVNGKIAYSFPACYQGREVTDVQLTFKDGKVSNYRASRNEEFLEKMLNMDDGAKYVGEAAIGTNYSITKFTKNTLFDEKIGGTCHFAVGKAYPETGSKNESGLHWDMVCDLRHGGEIYADDELIYKDGKFVKDFFDGLPAKW